ncbi:hypothetical protein XA68_10299 [Ophiocordyceps unilateralis]|uniref:Elongator complex protein 4 n=1 Tax=Ophiocordyceps unilateralis TaxID=268505 RepID=A0A2A9NZE7_OPHUN|nr:hypothetical protein XA68_10299 [Ophiocordyceps unilateralis]
MAFRKRNHVIHLSASSARSDEDQKLGCGNSPPLPQECQPRTSTGTPSLDQILTSQRGLPLGTSLLVEETGTTDHGCTLLRYFAAEGLVQGHQIHCHGLSDVWQQLPGLVGEQQSKDITSNTRPHDKMKIAWRYETLNPGSCIIKDISGPSEPFCHTFDLSKRLERSAIRGQLLTSCHGSFEDDRAETTLKSFLTELETRLRSSSPLSMHRIMVPSLLSPALYGPTSYEPQGVLQFIHGVRSLLRQFTTATALVSIPISLYPRPSGLLRWIELLFDGVIEIDSLHCEGQSSHSEKTVQGVLRILSLPLFQERGGGHESFFVQQESFIMTNAIGGLTIQPSNWLPIMVEKSDRQYMSNNNMHF